MTRRTRLACLAIVPALASATTLTSAAPMATAAPSHARAGVGKPAVPFDFNGDGRQDLTAGMPEATLSGEVAVVNGTKSGLSRHHRFLALTPADHPGGNSNSQNFFGEGVASADLNDDGYADLVVSSQANLGSLYIYDGSPTGLHAGADQVINDSADGLTFSVPGFVAIGDVNSDGYPDLLVQAQNYNDRSNFIDVLLGSVSGYSVAQSYSVFAPHDVTDGPDRSDVSHFGSSIAIGDVNHDGHPDMVVGAYKNIDVDDGNTPGGTWYCPGTAQGPLTCTKIGSSVTAVAIGNVTGGSRASVVTGGYSRVTLYRGVPTDDSSRRSTTTLDGRGVPGSAKHDHRYGSPLAFGSSLILGDIDHGGKADAVVGDPNFHHGAGSVVILRGSRHGFAKTGNVRIDAASKGVPGRQSKAAFFGSGLSLMNVRGHGRPELLVGAEKGNGDNQHPGTVAALRLGKHGVVAKGAQLIRVHRGTSNDHFGGLLGVSRRT